MKPYDREKPLISIHVPKCAGGSFGVVLQSWFGPNLCPHYPNWELRQTPPRYDLKEGICIHGHFNSFKGVGVLDYYPQVEQFITILRDPFEMAVSFYFFRKRPDKDGPTWEKRRPRRRRDVGTYLKNRRAYMLHYMPRELTLENYKEMIERYFIYIGIAEDLQTSTDVLAEKLGFPSVEVGRMRVSHRNEEILPELRDEFVENHPLEYAVYEYALKHYKQ